MPQYDFQSPGANAATAIKQILLEREMQKRYDEQQARQAQLDQMNQKNLESQMADREANRKLQEENIASQKAAREEASKNAALTRSSAIAEQVPKGTEMTPELEQALGPLAGMSTKTPGFLSDESQPSMQGPTITKTFAGTAKQAQNEDVLAMKQYVADVTAKSKEQAMEIQKAVLEGRMNDSQARLALQQANFELHQKMADIEGQVKQQKLDAAEKTKTDAKTKVAFTRSNLRSLIDEIADDPNLGQVVGPIAGRTKSVLPGAVKLDTKIAQLQKSLALENRDQLRGQGAVSDFEGRMVEAAVSALNQTGDVPAFKAELAKLKRAFHGDTPREAISEEEAKDTNAPMNDQRKKYGY